ncbi:MAG: TetR/AcrR family transcriptional regulator [Saprospiraceae bacterium]|jgi:AcrR family transcriptional regulator|nr:TetR/AcrR family transcriptional regulator [Saprospiraceae bacterium]MBK6480824.1 TetR/AcrR family transcriptional regulator [Saprospiraceae bacterium]MBK6816820.1 TetR/AcrR family transcriptional regulator [Saprospiraceae bacterium]MBK7371347.1 TetR/AcrR family transcriptional regulator [Saprospiraceae bacterium]MBK7436158.1 TetR/AcrR family transcriptional regulator [Saprospiraceae bacterium]
MSPRTKEQYTELRSQSKSIIEAAALELFGHQGYMNTSIAQIAQKAGVSKGLLYNYYSGKSELLKSILLSAMEHGDQMLSPDQFVGKSPVQMLEYIVDESFQMITTNVSYWKLLASLSFQEDIMKELTEIIQQKIRLGIEFISPVFESLGYPDPVGQAYLFGAAMDGILYHFVTLVQDYPLENTIKLFKQNFCKPYSAL